MTDIEIKNLYLRSDNTHVTFISTVIALTQEVTQHKLSLFQPIFRLTSRATDVRSAVVCSSLYHSSMNMRLIMDIQPGSLLKRKMGLWTGSGVAVK